MRLSIQTIVFNAESILPKRMLQKNIEQWVDIADEIIIVEGATKAQTRPFDGETSNYTQDGKSTDNTIDVLQNLKNKYSKIKLILAKGFWDGKVAMCNAAAQEASGDYLWQVDSDEFYHEKDIPIILKLLDEEKPDAVHFYANHFFRNYQTIMGYDQWWGNGGPWERIFRNTPGSHWVSHEPPNYQLTDGTICNKGKVINREQTKALDVFLYHYSYVTKEQVEFKAEFFKNPQYLVYWDQWGNNNDVSIFGSKTTPFLGEHPACIKSYL